MIIKPLFCLTALCVFTTALAAQESSVSEAMRGLTSEDQDTRSKSIAYLKDHYAEAKPAMLAAFDKLDEVASGVSYAFHEVGERAMPDLIAAFEGASKSRKFNLARTLGGFEEKAKAAVPTLLSQLDDKDVTVRCAVLVALGDIGDPRSLPVLAKHLRDKDKRARLSAIGALAAIGPGAHPVAPEIIQFVKNEREDAEDAADKAAGMDRTRYYQAIESAKLCLGSIGRRAAPLLDKEIVNRSNPTQQRIYFLDAIVPMANWAEKGDAVLMIPTLKKTIDDPDPDVRWHVLGVLSIVCRIGESKIDPDKELGWLFEPEAIRKMSLAERLRAASSAVEFKKYRWLAIMLIEQGLRSPDKAIIRQAIGGSGELGSDLGSVAPALIRLMQHTDEEIRRLAVGRVNSDPRFIAALPTLVNVAKNDKSDACRRTATKKIGVITAAIPQLPIP